MYALQGPGDYDFTPLGILWPLLRLFVTGSNQDNPACAMSGNPSQAAAQACHQDITHAQLLVLQRDAIVIRIVGTPCLDDEIQIHCNTKRKAANFTDVV